MFQYDNLPQDEQIQLGLWNDDQDESYLRNLSVYATVRPHDLKFLEGKRISDLLRVWNLPEENSSCIEGLKENYDLKEHELQVKLFSIDQRITPCFRYRVRYIGSSEYLFGGEARRLESIGLGYAKRLTFSGDGLNHNDCYFWTDSYPDGFAFCIEAVQEGEEFTVYDSRNRIVGEVKVQAIVQPEIEQETKIETDGTVVKMVFVQLGCAVKYFHSHSGGLVDVHQPQEIEIVKGVAEVAKPRGQKEGFARCITNVHLKRTGPCSFVKET
ncbi:hypothetical protein CHS0354_035885 [Potamilus streckersoni]|uniref:Uncharacterized protein n=1 Tax=Potamilus streckersoni TaxID=2493646 RepID=A0AAE0VZN2_9BIVA|nr:hypothetical protein CHS0354_035885 [Potamilus streckersoni]